LIDVCCSIKIDFEVKDYSNLLNEIKLESFLP
jgi:hypothetical protein